MNLNSFKNIYIANNNRKPLLDYSIIINDSNLENNDVHPYHLDDQINQINSIIFENKETELNEKNNLEQNNYKILSDTTKYIIKSKNIVKKDMALDNGSIYYNFDIYNYKDYNNSLKKESFKELDSHEPKIISQPKKKRGRKSKKMIMSLNKSNEFSNDNILRKCKNLVLTYSLEFLNYQIMKIYNGNIGQGIHMKKLLDIGQEYKSDNTGKYMRKFLKKTLKEIFSVKISTKYTSFLSNHNEIVIKKILNDKDGDKRERFKKIFNLTFTDCLKLFLGQDNFEEFDGFRTFEEIKFKLNEEPEHLKKIKESLNNFEEIIKSIKPRKINKNVEHQ